MDADGTGTVGTSEVVAGARVWLQLSPSSLPAEGATSETEEEEERQEEWGEEGEAGGGSKKQGAGGGGCAGRAGTCEAQARTHAASVCTQCAPDRRLARSPPAHASLFSKSAAQPPAAATGAERTVCGSAGAGDPAPRPTRRRG